MKTETQTEGGKTARTEQKRTLMHQASVVEESESSEEEVREKRKGDTDHKNSVFEQLLMERSKRH